MLRSILVILIFIEPLELQLLRKKFNGLQANITLVLPSRLCRRSLAAGQSQSSRKIEEAQIIWTCVVYYVLKAEQIVQMECLWSLKESKIHQWIDFSW